jgi:hypothetical protein
LSSVPPPFEFEVIEPNDMPVEVFRRFQGAWEQLPARGFVPVAVVRYTKPGLILALDAYVSLWANEGQGDSAQVIGIGVRARQHKSRQPQSPSRVVTYVTYRTEFTDGTSIQISNRSTVSSWPTNERVSDIACPNMTDLTRLYQVHRARADRNANGRSSTLNALQQPALYVQHEYVEDYERLIGARYYAFDAASSTYQPTLKGACLMTWRQLPPFRQIARFRRWQRTRRILSELKAFSTPRP